MLGKLNTTGTVLLLAGVVPTSSALAQSVLDGASNENELQIVEEIREVEARDGPNSPDSIDLFATLGLRYQESGDATLAAAAFARALEVMRINHGLYSLDQAPLIRRLINYEEGQGDFAAAWDLEKELLALARRNPGDMQTASIFHEVADKRMDVLRRYDAGEFPPQIVLGCYYNPLAFLGVVESSSCYSGQRSYVISSLLREAQSYYLGAIEILQQQGLYASDELRDLEMELVRGSYLYGGQGIVSKPLRRSTSDVEVGRESLERLASYEEERSAPLSSQANALVQVADWDLLYSRSRKADDSALQMYAQAYEQLEQEDAAKASIDRIFAPETPVVLPAFLPNPLASVEPDESTGYIDVAFKVTKYGESRQVEVLDTTNATRAARGRLVRLIKGSLFRPRVTDGEFSDAAPIVMRYYVNE